LRLVLPGAAKGSDPKWRKGIQFRGFLQKHKVADKDAVSFPSVFKRRPIGRLVGWTFSAKNTSAFAKRALPRCL